MRILSHYFIGRFLGLFAMVLAVAFLLLATVELVLNLDDVSAFGSARGSAGPDSAAVGTPPSSSVYLDSIANTLRYLTLRLTSYYLADVIPIASFIAVFVTFAIAGRAVELLAIQAGGVRLVRIVVPVLSTALILSLATALLHETVILRAEELWSGERHDPGGQIEFGRGAFWYHKGMTITNVAGADPETRTLHGVEIFERDPSGATVRRVVRADRVEIGEDGRWHIDQARIWTFDPDQPRSDPRLEESAAVVLDLDALRGDRLLGADPKLLPLPDLARYLESNRGETSSSLRQARVRYHERLSDPWLVLVFAWLATPFALRVDHHGRVAGPAAAAIVALGLYFLVESAGQVLSREALIPIGIAPWATMLIFSLAAAGGLALRRRA